jgi:uncharacterized protein YjdB
VARVQVAPPTITIRAGEKYTLVGVAYDRNGSVMLTATLTWNTNNRGIATVDQDGTVTGVGPGAATVTASWGSGATRRQGTATVLVQGGAGGAGGAGGPTGGGGTPNPGGVQGGTPGADPTTGQPVGSGPAAALQIEPRTLYLLVYENLIARVRAVRADGQPAAPVRPTWRSLNESVVTADPATGLVTGVAEGQGTLQVSAPAGAGGATVAGTAAVVVQRTPFKFRQDGPLVLSPGTVDTLRVIVPAQQNRELLPLQLQWLSTSPDAVRVDLNGIVTASSPGQADVIVSGYLLADTVQVRVHRVVDMLETLPRGTSVMIPLQATATFTARARAADNTPVADAPIRWSIGDSAIATFDTLTGLLLGRQAGTTTVTVRGPGRGLEKTWTVNVVAASIRLSHARFGIGVGDRREVRASFVDTSGAVVGPAAVSWSTSDANVATVSDAGVVTGVGYGRATITASGPGGRRATLEAFVQGELIVASNRGGSLRLYSAERATVNQLRPLSRDTTNAFDAAYSPDGSRVAFVSTRGGKTDLYVMDADGTNVKGLTADSAAEASPAWSPDGLELYYQSDRTGHPQIWMVGVDGSAPRQLTQELTPINPQARDQPSRDERRRRERVESDMRDRGEVAWANMHPTVSPDGRTVALVSTREGVYDIWLMGRDGSNQRNFSSSAAQKEYAPRFLPDGSLAYVVVRGEGRNTSTQIVRVEIATAQVAPISGTDMNVLDYAVSPKGDYMAIIHLPPNQDRRRAILRLFVGPVGASAFQIVTMPPTESLSSPTLRP